MDVVASLLALTPLGSHAQAPGPVGQPDLDIRKYEAGIFAFTGHCASCHDTGKNGAANRAELVKRTPEDVLASITSGSMAQYTTA